MKWKMQKQCSKHRSIISMLNKIFVKHFNVFKLYPDSRKLRLTFFIDCTYASLFVLDFFLLCINLFRHCLWCYNYFYVLFLAICNFFMVLSVDIFNITLYVLETNIPTIIYIFPFLFFSFYLFTGLFIHNMSIYWLHYKHVWNIFRC